MRPCASYATVMPSSAGVARTPSGETSAATRPSCPYSTAERSAKVSRAVPSAAISRRLSRATSWPTG